MHCCKRNNVNVIFYCKKLLKLIKNYYYYAGRMQVADYTRFPMDVKFFNMQLSSCLPATFMLLGNYSHRYMPPQGFQPSTSTLRSNCSTLDYQRSMLSLRSKNKIFFIISLSLLSIEKRSRPTVLEAPWITVAASPYQRTRLV